MAERLYSRYFKNDFEIKHTLSCRLRVICFDTRAVVSDTWLANEREADSAMAWLGTENLYDFILESTRGRGWMETHLILSSTAKENARRRIVLALDQVWGQQMLLS